MTKENLPENLLRLMRAKNYVPQTLPELALQLRLERKNLPQLKKTLAEMLKDGSIAKVKGDRYGASADLDLVAGTIDFRQNGWAVLRLPDGKTSIDVRPDDTSVALNGDRVLARLYADNSMRRKPPFGRQRRGKNTDEKYQAFLRSEKKYAKVIRILERNNERVIGTLQRSYNFWHVVPDDPHFFYDIIVGAPEQTGLFPVPQENDKVVVFLNDWKQRHINPTGTIIENLGPSHTPMAEYKAVLSKYELSETFPNAVLEEVKRVPSEVSQKEISGRNDMRGVFTITIDPEDAKDFDDALSIERTSGGEWEIGVHIADVSYYVRANSQIDKEARKRGNSTYLVGTVIPMLPFELSNGICSLVEDKDRLVKSVFLRYDAAGDCTGVRFANSVIRSQKRLSYKQAYAFLTEDDIKKISEINPPPSYETAFTGKRLDELDKHTLLNLRTMIRRMWSIAATLRKKRMRKGSLDLDIPEFKIFCDKDGYADRIEKSENNESHQLIEEFMLAANEAVARELFDHHLPYISRVHDDPDEEKLAELREDLETFNIRCGDLTSRKEVMRVLAEISKHPQSYILKTKFLRSLKRAEYRASADGHYGLNKVYYAHFTSPIRRFADLTVHRQMNYLMRELNMKSAPRSPVQLQTKASLEQTAEHITKTEQNSAEAERESKKIKLMEYFERSVGTNNSFEAVITSVTSHGFFVELTESMAYGFVHVHTLQDDIYHIDTDALKLRGRRTGRTFSVGEKVRVEVESVDRFKRQIDFHIAGSYQSKNKRKTRR